MVGDEWFLGKGIADMMEEKPVFEVRALDGRAMIVYASGRIDGFPQDYTIVVNWSLSRFGEMYADELLAISGEGSSNGWQPIETAPKDGTNVLLFECGKKHPVAIGFYISTEEFRYGKPYRKSEEWINMGGIGIWGGNAQAAPTHWMPLPDAPPDKLDVHLSATREVSA